MTCFAMACRSRCEGLAVGMNSPCNLRCTQANTQGRNEAERWRFVILSEKRAAQGAAPFAVEGSVRQEHRIGRDPSTPECFAYAKHSLGMTKPSAYSPCSFSKSRFVNTRTARGLCPFQNAEASDTLTPYPRSRNSCPSTVS